MLRPRSANLLCVLLLMALGGLCVGCKRAADPAPVIDQRLVQPAQASIVSVLATGASTADIQIKSSYTLKTAPQLTALSVAGPPLTLTAYTEPSRSPNGLIPLPYPFQLIRYRVGGLVAGQTYRFQLRFAYNNQDTLTVERSYTHGPAGHWTPLAHLPFDNGQFTGTPVVNDYERTGDAVSLFRYVDASTTDQLLYYRTYDVWQMDANGPGLPASRPGIIQFNLYFANSDRYRFWGLGYQVSDLYPDKYVYLRDMYGRTPYQGFVVLPSYLGPTGETAFFTTVDQAYLLTQNGSPALFSISAIGTQQARPPLPEKPGTLATFTLDSVGYVVNQVGAAPPRLWAFDTRTDTWSRRADFPGLPRSRGIGFAVGGKGYFGLGTAPQEDQGYRDLWQYEPAADRWQYVTEYPGQGHRYVVGLSMANRAFVGLGYETQPVVSSQPGIVRQVGCTDFWEFIP